ncbi:MAG: phosphate/phosphite/phosphonate ABC transporter substrate-binding protein [Sulfurifustis sp.]
MFKAKSLIAIVVAVLLVGGGLYYYRGAEGKPAPSAAARATSDVLVFTSPPRESAEEAELTYKPIAEYLSRVTGKRVVYKYPGTWGVYRTEMLNDAYDVVFDGPHFVDYRVQKLRHNVLAKLPEIHEFVIVVRQDEKLQSAAELAGKTFCSQSPPNLGSLIVLSQFHNASRQPILVPTKGWKEIYDGVMSRRCVGGVMPLANLTKFDQDEKHTRVIFKNRGIPNQAFTASSRVTPEDQAKIAAALTAPEATVPTEKLRARFNVTERLVTANNAEYAGISDYLRGEFGFFQQ